MRSTMKFARTRLQPSSVYNIYIYIYTQPRNVIHIPTWHYLIIDTSIYTWRARARIIRVTSHFNVCARACEKALSLARYSGSLRKKGSRREAVARGVRGLHTRSREQQQQQQQWRLPARLSSVRATVIDATRANMCCRRPATSVFLAGPHRATVHYVDV